MQNMVYTIGVKETEAKILSFIDFFIFFFAFDSCDVLNNVHYFQWRSLKYGQVQSLVRLKFLGNNDCLPGTVDQHTYA